MKIQGLLKNQKIEIDPHKRGCRSHNNWDDPSTEVHIDKVVQNNKDRYSIRIPLNRNTPITVNRKAGLGNAPNWLIREVNEALADEKNN